MLWSRLRPAQSSGATVEASWTEDTRRYSAPTAAGQAAVQHAAAALSSTAATDTASAFIATATVVGS